MVKSQVLLVALPLTKIPCVLAYVPVDDFLKYMRGRKLPVKYIPVASVIVAVTVRLVVSVEFVNGAATTIDGGAISIGVKLPASAPKSIGDNVLLVCPSKSTSVPVPVTATPYDSIGVGVAPFIWKLRVLKLPVSLIKLTELLTEFPSTADAFFQPNKLSVPILLYTPIESAFNKL